MARSTHILKAVAVPLALAVSVFFLETLFTNRPRVEVVASETALESLLTRDDFMVFGLFNSLACNKCISYFQKMEEGFRGDAELSAYDFHFKVVDRAMFMRRAQPLDFVAAANMVLFYSRKRLYFFHDFVRVAQTFDFRRKRHSEVVTQAKKFLETHIKFLKELRSLEEVREAVGKEGVIAVLFGSSGPQWDAFRDIAREHFDLPLFFVRDQALQEQILVYYAGFWVDVSETVAVLRRNDKVNFIDTDSFGLVPFDPSPSRFQRRLLLEMSTRLQVDPPPESMVKALFAQVPLVLFVESPFGDPQRLAKVQVWFEFLKNTEKEFYSCVLSTNSQVLRLYEALFELTTIQEDWVFVLTNPGRDSFAHVHLRKAGGDFSTESLIREVDKILFNERMAPLVEAPPAPISPKAVEILKNFFIGKSLDLPRASDLLGN